MKVGWPEFARLSLRRVVTLSLLLLAKETVAAPRSRRVGAAHRACCVGRRRRSRVIGRAGSPLPLARRGRASVHRGRRAFCAACSGGRRAGLPLPESRGGGCGGGRGGGSCHLGGGGSDPRPHRGGEQPSHGAARPASASEGRLPPGAGRGRGRCGRRHRGVGCGRGRSGRLRRGRSCGSRGGGRGRRSRRGEG